jgi:hypothetical protein
MTIRNIFAVHAYGEPIATDWCNTPLIPSDHACANHERMSCYAQARRAPHLDEYDHDAQGF